MTNGIHHVTAIAGPAHRNLDFYTRVLGQRFVKKTVNFDDPATYHFYFGDEAGRPGTILTFFPWGESAPGRLGIGETQETVYRVPETALGFWLHRLIAEGVPNEGLRKRFGQTVLPFRDPDGMRVALLGLPGIETEAAWTTQQISSENALRGFHSVSLLLEDGAATADILANVFGFSKVGVEETVTRYAVRGNPLGGIVDIRSAGGFLPARQGVGSVHHVAFRAADDATQAMMVEKLRADHGIETTEQKDRDYFRSVYFREPGGILFEIATDQPGFAVDEPADQLGRTLKLPRGLEPMRAEITSVLPDVEGVVG